MTCDSRGEQLLLYVHNALPPVDCIKMMAHLAACRVCRARLAGLRKASSALRSSLGPGPSIGLNAVQATLVLIAVAAVLAVVSTGYGMMQPRNAARVVHDPACEVPAINPLNHPGAPCIGGMRAGKKCK